jgi:hypothetical protein
MRHSHTSCQEALGYLVKGLKVRAGASSGTLFPLFMSKQSVYTLDIQWIGSAQE